MSPAGITIAYLKGMTIQCAKETMVLLRPSTSDKEEQEIAAVGSDPEPGRWFAKDCVFCEAQWRNFRQIPVPHRSVVLAAFMMLIATSGQSPSS